MFNLFFCYNATRRLNRLEWGINVPNIITLLVIIVIVLLAYALVYYLGQKQNKTNSHLEEEKQAVLSIPVADKLYTLKNKQMSGKTANAFEGVQAEWRAVTKYNLPEIEAALVSAQAMTDKYKLVKARQTTDNVERLLEEAKRKVNELNDRLTEILGYEKRNEARKEVLSDRYQQIRKQLLAHSYAYGPAIDTLEKNLSYIELDLTKYNELTIEGDFISAEEVMTQIDNDIQSMERMLEEIPQLLDTIEQTHHGQLDDLSESYRSMRDELYLFPQEIDIPKEIEEAEKAIHNTQMAIAEADLEQASALLKRSEVQIDRTYHLMEKEVEAKRYIETHQTSLQQKLARNKKNNRYALLELDRLSQDYILQDGELEHLEGYSDQLARLQETIDYTGHQMTHHAIAYSDAQMRYSDAFSQLEAIDQGQNDLVSGLAGLKQKEKACRDHLYQFELALKNIKRQVGRYHLPGLSDAYLKRFFACEDEVESFRAKLNRVKLDMAELSKMDTSIAQEVDNLNEEIQQVFKNVRTLEIATQYANRYRQDHPEVSDAIDQMNYYFNERYDYAQALQLLLDTVDHINPGASNEIKALAREEDED